jgi:hypothetical protein
MKTVDVLLFTIFLCGCSPMVWMRPNTTPEQTQQDGAECRIAAYGKYPYKELLVEHEHSPTTSEDANQMIRDANAAFCLRAKGYIFQRPKSARS